MMADQHPWSHGVLAESKMSRCYIKRRGVQEKLNVFKKSNNSYNSSLNLGLSFRTMMKRLLKSA